MAAVGLPKSKLPSMQRVSPGVYRGAGGGLQQSQNGMAPKLAATPARPMSGSNGAGTVNAAVQPNLPAPAAQGDVVASANAAASTAPGLNDLNAQRQRTLDEIHRRGGVAKTPGFATRLNDLNSQIRGLRNKPPPGAPGTGGPLLTEDRTIPDSSREVPTNPAADPSAVDPSIDAATKALYPSMNYTLPENYQGSPMYKFQMDQGTKALNRKLAQRGLLDSGAEIQATNDLSQSVGAQESDRLRQDYQTEADRYERVSANEAARLQREGQDNWGRRMDILNSLNKQSPMDYAYQGTNAYSGLDMKQGAANSANTANNYKRVSAGGGRSVAPFTPPAASGPDYSQINMMNALFGNSGSRQTGSVLDSFIGSLGL